MAKDSRPRAALTPEQALVRRNMANGVTATAIKRDNGDIAIYRDGVLVRIARKTTRGYDVSMITEDGREIHSPYYSFFRTQRDLLRWNDVSKLETVR